jgi:uncharacterized membrane protein YdjX (TVP38/TMEM64 family)
MAYSLSRGASRYDSEEWQLGSHRITGFVAQILLPEPGMESRCASDRSATRRWPLAGLGVLLLVALAFTLLVDVRAAVATLQGWAWQLGELAPMTYALGYVVVTLLGVPATPLVAIAALLFGPVRALVIMATASTVSALLAFRIARSTARPAIADRLRSTPAYARLCRLVERHGALVIPFVRLTPVLPFAAVNYGLGLTRIGFWRYAVWSAVAILAGDALLVFGTDALYDVLTGASLSWLVLGGTAAGLAAVVTLAVVSRRRSLPGTNYPDSTSAGG